MGALLVIVDFVNVGNDDWIGATYKTNNLQCQVKSERNTPEEFESDFELDMELIDDLRW